MAQKADCTLRSGLFGQPGGLLPVQRSSEMIVNPVPQEGGFWYRISLPYRKRLFFAPRAFENASRTPGAPLRYRASIPYTRKPSPVPNATSAKRRKTLPAHEFLKLPEKRRPLQKAQPGMPPRASKSQPKSSQCRPKATQCHSEKPRCPKATQCHQKVDITPLSKSKKAEQKN